MNKVIIGSLVVMVLAIGGIFVLLRGGGSHPPVNSTGQTNVSVIDGKQVVEIKAKGGYAPRVTVAKANMPTVITFKRTEPLTVRPLLPFLLLDFVPYFRPLG